MTGRARTTAEFIERARQTHGETYDYSLVDYGNSVTPVTIVCQTHGRFQQTPDGHLRGSGCPRCAWAKPRRRSASRTTAGFVARARAKHPAEGYDYSLVVYVDQRTAVTIICPEHGPFAQKPYVHMSKRTRGGGYCGCPRCGSQRAAATNLRPPEEVLSAARERHADRYDYSQAVYRGAREPMTILCREHGPFDQVASNHLAGKGCPRCQIDNNTLSVREFTARMDGVYDQQYDYSALPRLVPATARIRVRCREHGRFDVNSRTHLEGRSACPDCTQYGSRFERRIERLLEGARIPYESQWTHPTLRHRGRLRFDFMLPQHQTLIEFDGVFHFKPIRMPGQSWEDAIRAYDETRHRDALKTSWAQDHGYRLLRISSPDVEGALRAAGILPTIPGT